MRIVVIEDHRFVAELLAGQLAEMGHDATVAGPAEVPAVLASAPDLVVLDLQLGDVDGSDLVPRFVASGTGVIVLSGTPDVVTRARCLESGALAVLDKAAGLDRVIDSLRRAVEGQTAQPHADQATLLASAREARRARRDALAPFGALTAREEDVLAGLVAGMSVADLARELYLSVETVRSYVKTLLRKLGVNSQLAAVAMAAGAGWTSPRRLRTG